MDIRVREQRLPGIGMRYELGSGDGSLFVVAGRDGTRVIGVADQAGEARWQQHLSAGEAVMVSALLLGARFSFDEASRLQAAPPEVVVDTVELGPASPAVGRTHAEIELPDPEAVVLAVISDRTPDLVEDRREHRCLPGDRVVVAGRAGRIDEVVTSLVGPPAPDADARG